MTGWLINHDDSEFAMPRGNPGPRRGLPTGGHFNLLVVELGMPFDQSNHKEMAMMHYKPPKMAGFRGHLRENHLSTAIKSYFPLKTLHPYAQNEWFPTSFPKTISFQHPFAQNEWFPIVSNMSYNCINHH